MDRREMSTIDMGGKPSAEVPVDGAVDRKPESRGTPEPPMGGIYECGSEPTLASTWYAASGAPISDRLLEWPPDVFALANVVLARAEAFRYALTVADWPPRRLGDWAQAVEDAGRRWSAWAEDRTGSLPDLVAVEWSVLCQGAQG